MINQQTCSDGVTLCGYGSKVRYGSFQLWINVWVAGDPSLYLSPQCKEIQCFNCHPLPLKPAA